MDDLETELSRQLADVRTDGASTVAARVRTAIGQRVRTRRIVSILAVAVTAAAAMAMTIGAWALAKTALRAFDTNRETDVLIWLPVAMAMALIGLGACTVTTAIVRSRAAGPS